MITALINKSLGRNSDFRLLSGLFACVIVDGSVDLLLLLSFVGGSYFRTANKKGGSEIELRLRLRM
ncbi:hypothetical protein N9093_01255 [bacterium]|nr:hypothetical protein [bacterium]MDB4460340.1 hypothetical protein [bacterium]MDB4468464.1 hypothetical protein [bacterium]